MRNCIVRELEQYDESPIGIQSLPDSLAYNPLYVRQYRKTKGRYDKSYGSLHTISDLNNKIKLNKTDRLIGYHQFALIYPYMIFCGAFSTGAALVMVRDARDCSEIVSLLRKKLRYGTRTGYLLNCCSTYVERGMKDSLSLRQIMLSEIGFHLICR